MLRSLVGSEMCIRDRLVSGSRDGSVRAWWAAKGIPLYQGAPVYQMPPGQSIRSISVTSHSANDRQVRVLLSSPEQAKVICLAEDDLGKAVRLPSASIQAQLDVIRDPSRAIQAVHVLPCSGHLAVLSEDLRVVILVSRKVCSAMAIQVGDEFQSVPPSPAHSPAPCEDPQPNEQAEAAWATVRSGPDADREPCVQPPPSVPRLRGMGGLMV
eukprot:TRINITY_DN45166_c0_g1_i3.p1 TRINITY_DN45166_c0_g1~~TRINITY_DN45166_c0_g1_i3.p1  ORF type:complete len:212 (-),score=30.49 TRINITY_DN45166_c0_g1_i3:195-830(-)